MFLSPASHPSTELRQYKSYNPNRHDLKVKGRSSNLDYRTMMDAQDELESERMKMASESRI